MITWSSKDPDEVLDYGIEWYDPTTPVLLVDEVITLSPYTVTQGTVVIESQDFTTPGLTTCWLSGGAAGETCVLLNRITTSSGRVYDQSAKIKIQEN